MAKENIKKRMVSCIFSMIPFSVWSEFTGVRFLATMNHMVSDDDVIYVKHLYHYKNIKEFSSDIDFILRKFIPISLLDVLELLKGNKSLPEKSILFTFDDGFKEMYDIVAPILLEKGVPATFFINSGFTDNKQLAYENKASILIEYFKKETNPKPFTALNEILTEIGVEDIKSIILYAENQSKRPVLDKIAEVASIDFNKFLLSTKPYLSSEQVKGLIDSGFTIGAHSIDHPIYSSLSLDDQLHQTRESLRFIREKFNLDYGAFAFPQHDHDVSSDFFNKLHEEGIMDVSFGSSGMIDDSAPLNYQRFGLGKSMSAKRIIAFHYGKRLFANWGGRDKIIRGPSKPGQELNR